MRAHNLRSMDKLKQLESFVSVATRGSLTAAAKAEGVAPAIMGRRLDALEERLGVKLLVRTTRPAGFGRPHVAPLVRGFR